MSINTQRKAIGDVKLGFKGTLEVLKDTIKKYGFVDRKTDIFILILLTAVNIALPTILPILNRQITNLGVIVFNSSDLSAFYMLIAVIIGIFLLKILDTFLTPLNQRVKNRMTRRIRLKVNSDIVRKGTSMKLRYVNDSEVYDRISFVNMVVPGRVPQLTNLFLSCITSIFTLISVGVLVFSTSWIIGIVVLICSLPQIFLTYKGNNFQYHEAAWETAPNRRMWKAFDLATSPWMSAERIFYGFFPIARQRYIDSRNEVATERTNVNKKLTLYSIISAIPATLSYIFALGLIVYYVYIGETDVGTFSLMFSAVSTFFYTVTGLSNNILNFGYTAKYVYSLKAFDELEYERHDKNYALPEKSDIEFRDVHFTYPGSKKEVLHGINVKINQGEKIAIVGLNGSGKSTFTLLLTGLYEATGGQVLINGEDITKSPETLRKSMACIYQDFGKYEMSIADNILIGDTSREISREELEQICEITGVSKFASNFKNGIDTVLGSMGDEGVNLSGGQWQRVMLARALIRKDANILIFDEPTAALDPKSEAELYEDFNKLTGDKTTITISHRLGITGIVDRILVFEDGKIVEDGSHDELIAKDGLYKKMYQSQSQWYV